MNRRGRYVFVAVVFITLLILWNIPRKIYQTVEFVKEFERFVDIEKALCNGFVEISTWELPTKPCPTNGIVTIKSVGGLYDKLWESAAVWAIAKKTGLEGFIPRCMHKTVSKVFEEMPVTSMETIAGCPINADKIEWKYPRETENKIIILDNFANYAKDIGKLSEQVENNFIINSALDEEASKFIQSVGKGRSGIIYVGLAVRINNFIDYNLQNPSDYLKLVGKEIEDDFYYEAMYNYQEKYDELEFIVVTDDHMWSREMFMHLPNVTFTDEGNTPELNLAILSLCNDSIFDYGPSGSWAAFYAGGESVFYNVSGYIFPSDISKVFPKWHTILW